MSRQEGGAVRDYTYEKAIQRMETDESWVEHSSEPLKVYPDGRRLWCCYFHDEHEPDNPEASSE